MPTAKAGLSQAEVEEKAWLLILGKVALLFALLGLGLLAAFLGGVGFQASDNALGPDYRELLQAARAPVAYRIAMVFDALEWLAIGGILIAFSGVARVRAPLRSWYLFALGVGMFLGFLGGILRGTAVAYLASLYAAAAPAEQATIRSSFLVLGEVIRSLFHAGQLLQGIGFLLAGTIALRVKRFPRWLAYWVFLPGLLSFLLYILDETAPDLFFPVLLVHIFAFIALQAAIATRLWRIPTAPPTASM